MNDSRQNNLSMHYCEGVDKTKNTKIALQNRLNILKMIAHDCKLFSIENQINKILKSLQTNNPKPKILKGIARKIEALSIQIQLEQGKNQKTL